MAARRRAALYARQSITREGSASLDVQIEACRDAAKRLKVDVNSVFQKVESLSGGRQQSVAIARAISFSPRVVVLDEPTANLSVMATDRLLDACEEYDLPMLAGAATCSEVMALMERGYTVQKFFPAESNGGASALASIGAPLPQVSFCPTGGITLAKAPEYLKLKNVLCVGGSWVAPKALMQAGDWAGIEKLAAEAAALPR